MVDTISDPQVGYASHRGGLRRLGGLVSAAAQPDNPTALGALPTAPDPTREHQGGPVDPDDPTPPHPEPATPTTAERPAFDVHALERQVAAALADDDAAAAVALIEQDWRRLAAEHGAALRRLIAALPPSAWHERPLIAAALGASHRGDAAEDPVAAIAYFEAADGQMSREGVPTVDEAWIRLVQAAALRAAGRLDDADAAVSAVQPLLDGDITRDLSARIAVGAAASLQLGLTALQRGDVCEADAQLRRAAGLSTHLSTADVVECLGASAMVSYTSGELDDALRHVADARTAAAGTGLMFAPAGAPAIAAEQLVAIERHELSTASALTEPLARAARHSEWEPFAGIGAARIESLEHRFADALELLRRTRARYRGWSPGALGPGLTEVLRAGILIHAGQGDEAWRILSALEPDRGHEVCPARFTAMLRLANGDLDGAERALAACVELGEQHAQRTLVDVHLLRAAIDHGRGDLASSAVWMDRALHAIQASGTRMPFYLVPDALLMPMADAALARNPQPAIAAVLQRLRAGAPARERELPDQLSSRELGVLEQVRRGLGVAGIAAELYVSPNTVKTHLRSIYRKLGVRSRTEAMRKAESLGLYL